MSATPMEATCHCGAIRLEIDAELGELTDCNCSICRRYGALWAYFSPKAVKISDGDTDVYMWGERMIAFHRCKHCGCVTHWLATKPDHDRMGVNARLLPPDVLAKARIRRFDGADTWKELD